MKVEEAFNKMVDKVLAYKPKKSLKKLKTKRTKTKELKA
jgi:hypothetical protein